MIKTLVRIQSFAKIEKIQTFFDFVVLEFEHKIRGLLGSKIAEIIVGSQIDNFNFFYLDLRTFLFVLNICIYTCWIKYDTSW